MDGTQVLSRIDSVAWSKYEHPYGSAEDVPGRLRGLLASPETDEASEAGLFLVTEFVCNDSHFGDAAVPLIPYLLRLLSARSVSKRGAILSCLLSISRIARDEEHQEVEAHLKRRVLQTFVAQRSLVEKAAARLADTPLAEAAAALLEVSLDGAPIDDLDDFDDVMNLEWDPAGPEEAPTVENATAKRNAVLWDELRPEVEATRLPESLVAHRAALAEIYLRFRRDQRNFHAGMVFEQAGITVTMNHCAIHDGNQPAHGISMTATKGATKNNDWVRDHTVPTSFAEFCVFIARLLESAKRHVPPPPPPPPKIPPGGYENF